MMSSIANKFTAFFTVKSMLCLLVGVSLSSSLLANLFPFSQAGQRLLGTLYSSMAFYLILLLYFICGYYVRKKAFKLGEALFLVTLFVPTIILATSLTMFALAYGSASSNTGQLMEGAIFISATVSGPSFLAFFCFSMLPRAILLAKTKDRETIVALIMSPSSKRAIFLWATLALCLLIGFLLSTAFLIILIQHGWADPAQLYNSVAFYVVLFCYVICGYALMNKRFILGKIMFLFTLLLPHIMIMIWLWGGNKPFNGYIATHLLPPFIAFICFTSIPHMIAFARKN